MGFLEWFPQTRRDMFSSMVHIILTFVFSLCSTRLALEMGGGPPSLFWPTNGVITLFATYSSNIFTFLMTLVLGILGMAGGQLHIIDLVFGLKLGTSSLSEIIPAVLLLRLDRKMLEKKPSFNLIIKLFMYVSSVNCIIGATSGALVVTKEFPGVDFLITWTDWLIGDITGNFIVIYTWYITRHGFRLLKVDGEKSILKKISNNIVHTCVTILSICAIIFSYCIKFSPTSLGIPFVLLTTPFIASMGLIFHPIFVSLIDTTLVILITVGTRNKLGPIYSVFSDLSQRDVYIGVQLTFLITYILSSVLSVVRDSNISREKTLSKSSQDRLSFFSHISHELRTPLSVIIGYTESILNHEFIPEEVREDLVNVMEASITMSTTVNDLLVVFSSENHTLDIKKSVVITKDFFLGIISLVTQLSEKKNISIDISFSDDVPMSIITDPRRIRQVMLNIVNNSIKYTPCNGEIEVYVHLVNNNLIVSTKDSGVGIKEEDISQLFNRFFRCSTTINEQGTGLGLTVCQEIIKSMDGNIKVESVFGSGSTFIFEIPILLPDIESTLKTSESTNILVPFIDKNICVLVVEDSLLNNKLLVRILKRQGFMVESVTDGLSAMQAVLTGNYDIILLDLGLPLKSGIEVIREIRSNELGKIRNIPIIVTSGDVEEKTREICVKEGCNAFSSKPFREDEIKKAMISVLNNIN